MTAAASILFGGNGYLGALIAAAILAEGPRALVLPIRATADREACLARIRGALGARGAADELIEDRLRRISLVELPPPERIADLAAVIAAARIDEVIHSAGCLDYWDTRSLHAVNVELTRAIVELARATGIARILYISTAYCSGYTEGVIREQLHADPAPEHEPTEYTRTKRIAESIVAQSGLPFTIVRPSIVIGDSRTGDYSGRNYGLYQMWRAIEGLFTREYTPIWYTVATQARVNFVHQDAFQDAVLAIRAAGERAAIGEAVSVGTPTAVPAGRGSSPVGSIVHVVSDDSKVPTMLDLCGLWADVYRPDEIHCYASVDDVPLLSIPKRQRRFLEIAAKNLEIATRRWQFETSALDALRARGLAFADATLEAIARCQERYIERSARIQAYLQGLPATSPTRSRVLEIDRERPQPTCM
jgi:nucleoside-diphosphate-sugar epimerase